MPAYRPLFILLFSVSLDYFFIMFLVSTFLTRKHFQDLSLFKLFTGECLEAISMAYISREDLVFISGWIKPSIYEI